MITLLFCCFVVVHMNFDMLRDGGEALQHLLAVLDPTFLLGGWTPADVARLHSEGLAAARCLAPVDVDCVLASQVPAHDREALIQRSWLTLGWLLRGLVEQHFTGRAVTQQACELICALSDVLYVSMRAVLRPLNWGASSRAQVPDQTPVTFSRIMQLGYAGEVEHSGPQQLPSPMSVWAMAQQLQPNTWLWGRAGRQEHGCAQEHARLP